MVFKDEMLATVRAIYAGLPSHATTVERLMAVFDRMADYHAIDADLSRILLKELIVPGSPERSSDIAELMDAILDGLTEIVGGDTLANPRDAALTARSAFALYYFALISWLGSGFDRNWCMRLLREQLTLLIKD